jgi:hypothetical protein
MKLELENQNSVYQH